MSLTDDELDAIEGRMSSIYEFANQADVRMLLSEVRTSRQREQQVRDGISAHRSKVEKPWRDTDPENERLWRLLDDTEDDQ